MSGVRIAEANRIMRPTGFRIDRQAECAPFSHVIERTPNKQRPAAGGPGESFMHRVLILGAGKIGAMIAGLLGESGAYKVNLAEVDEAAAESVVRSHDMPHHTTNTHNTTNKKKQQKQHKKHPNNTDNTSLPYY